MIEEVSILLNFVKKDSHEDRVSRIKRSFEIMEKFRNYDLQGYFPELIRVPEVLNKYLEQFAPELYDFRRACCRCCEYTEASEIPWKTESAKILVKYCNLFPKFNLRLRFWVKNISGEIYKIFKSVEIVDLYLEPNPPKVYPEILETSMEYRDFYHFIRNVRPDDPQISILVDILSEWEKFPKDCKYEALIDLLKLYEMSITPEEYIQNLLIEAKILKF